jgi:hypothetical protein
MHRAETLIQNFSAFAIDGEDKNAADRELERWLAHDWNIVNIHVQIWQTPNDLPAPDFLVTRIITLTKDEREAEDK